MFPEYFVEAPVFFKRQNIYYALFGWCCCYCMQGSGVMVHTAKNPMGPYILQVCLNFCPLFRSIIFSFIFYVSRMEISLVFRQKSITVTR